MCNFSLLYCCFCFKLVLYSCKAILNLLRFNLWLSLTAIFIKEKKKKKPWLSNFVTILNLLCCFLFSIFGKQRPDCYSCLNNSFQYLNNITRIFIHFFTHMYFQKIQTTLLEISYQTDPNLLC